MLLKIESRSKIIFFNNSRDICLHMDKLMGGLIENKLHFQSTFDLQNLDFRIRNLIEGLFRINLMR